jgi:predicted transcriptional regulator
MNAVYRRGTATAKEIRASLPDPPTDSSVRVLLRILEEKGHLKHERDGRRYVYLPTVPASKAGYSELKQLKTTFFRDSVPSVVAALLPMSTSDLSFEDLDELSKLIDDAKK